MSSFHQTVVLRSRFVWVDLQAKKTKIMLLLFYFTNVKTKNTHASIINSFENYTCTLTNLLWNFVIMLAVSVTYWICSIWFISPIYSEIIIYKRTAVVTEVSDVVCKCIWGRRLHLTVNSVNNGRQLVSVAVTGWADIDCSRTFSRNEIWFTIYKTVPFG